jgi:hypothetical protein
MLLSVRPDLKLIEVAIRIRAKEEEDAVNAIAAPGKATATAAIT